MGNTTSEELYSRISKCKRIKNVVCYKVSRDGSVTNDYGNRTTVATALLLHKLKDLLPENIVNLSHHVNDTDYLSNMSLSNMLRKYQDTLFIFEIWTITSEVIKLLRKVCAYDNVICIDAKSRKSRIPNYVKCFEFSKDELNFLEHCLSIPFYLDYYRHNLLSLMNKRFILLVDLFRVLEKYVELTLHISILSWRQDKIYEFLVKHYGKELKDIGLKSVDDIYNVNGNVVSLPKTLNQTIALLDILNNARKIEFDERDGDYNYLFINRGNCTIFFYENYLNPKLHNNILIEFKRHGVDLIVDVNEDWRNSLVGYNVYSLVPLLDLNVNAVCKYIFDNSEFTNVSITFHNDR